MPKFVIVGSGPVDLDHLRQLCRGASQILCADGGAAAVLAAGIIPTAVVGDFDSLTQRDRKALEALPVQIHRHNRQKEQTDLELALMLALEHQPNRIFLTGVLGGRRNDHAMGNLLLLTLDTLSTADVIIDEGRTEAFVIRGQRRFYGAPGEYVSLLPISEQVIGVSTEGLRYPLSGAALTRGYTRGVSNEFVGTAALVSVEAGCLLVMHERTVADPLD